MIDDKVNLQDIYDGAGMTRLEHLEAKVVQAKRQLLFYQELVTHEVCLIHGKHYPINNREI